MACAVGIVGAAVLGAWLAATIAADEAPGFRGGVDADQFARLESRLEAFERRLTSLESGLVPLPPAPLARGPVDAPGAGRDDAATSGRRERIDPIGPVGNGVEARLTELEARVAAILESGDSVVWSRGIRFGRPEPDSPLAAAAESGDLATVRAALDAGADPNEVLASGDTLLGAAAGNGHEEIVDELLRRGASVDAADSRGYTGLMRAIQGSQEELAGKLLALGGDLEAGDQNGETALFWAAWRGQVGMVERLLDRGAAIDATSRTGNTALADAVRGGHLDVVRVLLARGASVTVASGAGSLVDLAESNGHAEVAALLRRYGAP